MAAQAQTVREAMTPDPVTLDAQTPVAEATRVMRDAGIGNVVVTHSAQPQGVLTDRDVVVRALAAGRDPASTPVGECCSSQRLVTTTPDTPTDEVVALMRANTIRRLPVIEDGRPVGMVSLGDLAIEHDRQSALGNISAAPPNT